jgi:Holliday junction resolvase-like predicted endonuclease
MNSWQVSVAAEAISAAQFARAGCDVSVQYGANQPEYDLIVAKGEKLMKVSVKGSQDDSWGLVQSDLAKLGSANYYGAIDNWLKRHGSRTVFCFVQFKNAELDEMPRLYLARPPEVAERLKATARGRGDTILYEKHSWGPRAVGAGTTEEIPNDWKFSQDRIDQLFGETSVAAAAK